MKFLPIGFGNVRSKIWCQIINLITYLILDPNQKGTSGQTSGLKSVWKYWKKIGKIFILKNLLYSVCYSVEVNFVRFRKILIDFVRFLVIFLKYYLHTLIYYMYLMPAFCKCERLVYITIVHQVPILCVLHSRLSVRSHQK